MDARGTTFAALRELPVRPGPTRPESAETGETAYLRRLLEIQPECLLRVGRDGLLLACNEAGLRLLGKDDLAQVLNRPLAEHLNPNDLAGWQAFTEQVWADGAGSFECDLAPAEDGTRRAAEVKAVAVRDHPDGLESILAVVRDASPLVLIEPALREQHAAAAELRTRIEGLQHEIKRLESERESADAARAVAEQRMKQSLHAEFAGERQLPDHSAVPAARTAEAAADQERFAGLVEQLRDDLRRMSADYEAGQAALARSLEEARADAELRARFEALQHEVLRLEAERDAAGAERAAAQQKLQQALEEALEAQRAAERQRADGGARAGETAVQSAAEQERLAGLVEQLRQDLRTRLEALQGEVRRLEGERDSAEAARAIAEEKLQYAHEQARRAEEALERQRAEHDALVAGRAQAAAEQERLAQLVGQLGEDLRRLSAEHETGQAAIARELQQARNGTDTRKKLEALQQDVRRLESERDAVAAARAIAEQKLQQAVEQARQAEEALERQRAEHDALAAGRAQAAAEQERLSALVGQLGDDLRRLSAEHETGQAAITRELQQARDGAELRKKVEALQHDVRRLESERDAAGAARAIAEQKLQQAVQQAREAEQAIERQRSEHEALAAERIQVAAEQERLAQLVEQLGGHLRRLSDDHDAGHAVIARELQETRSEAAARHEQYREALAEAEERYTQALAEFAASRDRDEPLITGRLAQQLSRELQTVVATLDERIQLLLGSPRVDASYRPMIEAVQADALRVAALVRQLCRTRPEPTPRPEPL